jgi:lactose/L-arabinose transport system substrate-binding protein
MPTNNIYEHCSDIQTKIKQGGNKMKKRLGLLLATGMLSFSMILAGCGNSSKESGANGAGGASGAAETKDEAATEETQKITVWAWDDNFNVAVMKTAAEYYKKLNPDANVEIEVISNSKEDIYKKLQTGLASGGKSLPDICLIEDYSIYQYLNSYSKYFYPLNDDVDYSQFSPYKVEVMTYNDKAYGIPFDAGVTGLFYRVDYLEQAGFTAADLEDITWDRFIEIGKQVEEQTGVKMTVANGTNYSSLFRTMMQSAGAWYCDSNGELTITNNEVLKESLETIKKMRDAGIILECADDSTLAGAINDGTTASVINAAWRVSTIKAEPEQSGKWAVASTPRLNNANSVNASNTGGSSWYVLDNGQDKGAIVDFLKAVYAGDIDFYSDILVNQGAVGTYLPAQEGQAYQTEDEFFGGQKVFAEFASWLPEVPSVMYGKNVPESNTAVNTALFSYLQGDISVEEALTQAEDQLKNQIQ